MGWKEGKFKILLTLVLCLLGVFLYKVKFSEKKASVTPSKSFQRSINVQSLDEKISSGQSINVLLLGYGGGNHDGANLTDSMILAHFDTKNKITTLISIPRDLWVRIPTNDKEGEYWKINAAYAIGLNDQDYPEKENGFTGNMGGGNLAKYEIGIVTGIPVDRFVALDFQGFVDAVNMLGGVDVNIQTAFDDYEYPIDGKENDLCGHTESELSDLEKIATISALQAFPCRFEHIHFDTGVTHLDGATALKFVRSRHSLQDGTDFGRSNRQRELLSAVKEKVYSLNAIPKLPGLITTFQSNVKTDLDNSDLQTLLIHANDFRSYQIHNLALTNQNFLTDKVSDDGQAILIPNQGVDQWGEIHSYLAKNLDNGSDIISPVIQVENGTTIAGLADLASNRLKDEDLNVLPPTTSADQNSDKTTVTVFNDHIDKGVLAGLEKEFNVTNLTTDSQTLEPYDILITVGRDYNQSHGKKIIN